jgi:hypothetical protein
MWAFEMRVDSQQDWQLSAKRAVTIEQAAGYAAAWLVTCAENNLRVEVRLVQVTYKHGENK